MFALEIAIWALSYQVLKKLNTIRCKNRNDINDNKNNFKEIICCLLRYAWKFRFRTENYILFRFKNFFVMIVIEDIYSLHLLNSVSYNPLWVRTFNEIYVIHLISYMISRMSSSVLRQIQRGPQKECCLVSLTDNTRPELGMCQKLL